MNWLQRITLIFASKPKATDNYQHIIAVIAQVESKNLSLVSQYRESTNGHNNAQCVREAIRFVKQQVDVAYARVGDDGVIVVSLRQLAQHQQTFLADIDDVDGVAGGTITDVVNALKSLARYR